MRDFVEHAEQTNDIFLLAAQVIANTLTRAAAKPAGTGGCMSHLDVQPMHITAM